MNEKIPFSLKVAIILLWALPQISVDLYLPSMPAMARYFTTSLDMVQYTIFFYSIGFSFGGLFFGPISDRIGRRPVILWNLLLAVFASFLATIATRLDILNLARLLQGVALVGVASTVRAVTKDICPTKEEMAKFGAILGIIIPLAASVAPVIGGYIEKYANWRFSFGLLLLSILALLYYVIKTFPETNQDKLQRPFKYLLVDYKEILSSGRFLAYNLLTAFALGSTFAYLTISPFLLQIKVGLSPEVFGYTNLLSPAVLIVSSYINSKMIYHKGIDKLLRLGIAMVTFAGIIFLLAGILNFINIYTILIPLLIMTCGCGFIYPNASAGSLSLFASSAGTAGAIYAFIQMGGGAMGSALISMMSKSGNAEASLGIIIMTQGLLGLYLVKKLIQNHK